MNFFNFYFLLERKQKISKGGKEIVYHGTTDKFLKSILSNGLLPSKEKVWADDPDATEHNPSRASYGGTYLTTNLLTAISSGRTAVNKLGGEKIVIVCANVQPRSGLPDEDNFYGVVGHAMDYTIGEKGKYSVGALTVFNALLNYYDGGKEFDENVSDFITKFKQFINSYMNVSLDKHGDISQLDNKLKKLYVAELLRRVSHYIADNSYKNKIDQYGGEKYKDQILKLDKKETEMEFAKILDSVMNTYKKQVYKQDDLNKTYRIKEPITYKGKNQIIAVVVLDNYLDQKATDDAYILRVVYGEMPHKLKKDFEERIRSNIKVIS